MKGLSRMNEKSSCPVCAVRRVVIFLPEAGEMREEISGLPVYLDVKTERDRSRLGKRYILESVVEEGNRRTRSLWVELNCPNSNPDGVHGTTHRKNA